MKKTAKITEKNIEIWFDFDWDTLNEVKSIPGRKFQNNRKGKYWTAPVSEKAVEILKNNGFVITEITDAAKTPIKEVKPIGEIPGLKRTLFDFQKEGVAFLEARKGRALLADEMGLGKTVQALAWLQLHPEKKPIIILCPAHLKLNWEHEAKLTLSGERTVQVLYGTDTSIPITGDIIIINYDILPNKYETYRDSAGSKRKKEIRETGWVDFLIRLNPQVLIFDEGHYIRSNSALRTKATKKLAKKIPHVIALTGTPIVNRPIEGYNLMKVIDDTLFPDFWEYARKYCDAKHNGWGWDFTGASNKEELHERLSSIMVRRKKADVLTDLPDKIYSYIPIELRNRKKYERAERDFIKYLKKEKGKEKAEKAERAEHLVKIEEMKQLAVDGKMEMAINWIQDFLDTNGQKLVLFTTHKETVSKLIKKFKDAVKIDGGMSAKDRDTAVKEFQNNDNVKLLIGNIQAAGTGLTLTAASSVAFLELPWTPGDVSQAEDRCHRIGQKNTVNVYYLLAEKTIEEEIARMLDEKKQVLGAVLDGKEVVQEDALITELIKSYKETL